jgi:hypothetical protein
MEAFVAFAKTPAVGVELAVVGVPSVWSVLWRPER